MGWCVPSPQRSARGSRAVCRGAERAWRSAIAHHTATLLAAVRRLAAGGVQRGLDEAEARGGGGEVNEVPLGVAAPILRGHGCGRGDRDSRGCIFWGRGIIFCRSSSGSNVGDGSVMSTEATVPTVSGREVSGLNDFGEAGRTSRMAAGSIAWLGNPPSSTRTALAPARSTEPSTSLKQSSS